MSFIKAAWPVVSEIPSMLHHSDDGLAQAVCNSLTPLYVVALPRNKNQQLNFCRKTSLHPTLQSG